MKGSFFFVLVSKSRKQRIKEKAPRLSIIIDILIFLSDNICHLNQFHTNSEAAMLSTYNRHTTTADITVREINAVGNKSMFILRYNNYVLFCVSVFYGCQALGYKLENWQRSYCNCSALTFWDTLYVLSIKEAYPVLNTLLICWLFVVDPSSLLIVSRWRPTMRKVEEVAPRVIVVSSYRGNLLSNLHSTMQIL